MSADNPQAEAEAIIKTVEEWAAHVVVDPNPDCACPNCRLYAAFMTLKEWEGFLTSPPPLG